jgi:hypothetical protein
VHYYPLNQCSLTEYVNIAQMETTKAYMQVVFHVFLLLL